MNKTILLTGAILGMLGIILGAFGAHGLKKLIEPEAVASFETGVRYQMYHALLLLVIGGMPLMTDKSQRVIFILTLIGVLLFSGSIYLLATNQLTSFDFKKIALITPLGGTILISAWGYMVYYFIVMKT